MKFSLTKINNFGWNFGILIYWNYEIIQFDVSIGYEVVSNIDESMQDIKRDLSREILWIIVQDCFSVIIRLE